MNFDIIIVGSGIVGLTLACALGEQGFKIAIVEGRVLPTPMEATTAIAGQVSAITRASQHILENLGVWQRLKQISPYQHMHVWEANSRSGIDFDSASVGEDNLGHIIENQLLRSCLYQQILPLPNISWHCPAIPQTLQQNHQQWTLGLADGTQLTADLIVGADGGQSWVRQALAIAVQQWEYGHLAITATVATEKPHQATAWQCFHHDGPLALLPLADPHQCALVWSTATAKAKSLLELPESDLTRAIVAASENRLGTLQLLTKVTAFPLSMRHAQHYVLPGVALIGDAAHTVHPLAGQGVNLGLLDAACLAEVVLQAKQQGRPVGALATLRRYERWRKSHNCSMIAIIEVFKRLFAQQNSLLRRIRQLGLNLTNSTPAIKRQCIKYAMGLTGDLPKLASQRHDN